MMPTCSDRRRPAVPEQGGHSLTTHSLPHLVDSSLQGHPSFQESLLIAATTLMDGYTKGIAVSEGSVNLAELTLQLAKGFSL